MKGNDLFSLQQIGDVYLLVPLREKTFQRERILPTNQVGALLWKTLQQECSEEALVAAVLEEYDICRETALTDIRSFLASLEKAGALV